MKPLTSSKILTASSQPMASMSATLVPQPTSLWFESNMADLFDLDVATEPSPIPEHFEVYEARKRPSALFIPEPSVVFDVESAPLEQHPSFMGLVTDSDKPSARRKPRREARKTLHGESTGRSTPRVSFDDSPTDTGPVYEHSSPKVSKHERDWEKLRQYFAWLPKLVIQKTFNCTTQYARIPMSAHLQRHYRSPFPALNVNRRNEPVATDTVFADTLNMVTLLHNSLSERDHLSATCMASKLTDNFCRHCRTMFENVVRPQNS